jgi:rhamnosyltransferase
MPREFQAGSRHKVAGVVILYNPQIAALDNIGTYIDQIDKLFVVDNSDIVDSQVVQSLQKRKNVIYIWNQQNLGIARALNIGAMNAIRDGYEYLLTMDQDSNAPAGMVAGLLKCLQTHDFSTVGILSPFHVTRNVPPPNKTGCSEVLVVMTSGNLLNLRIFDTVGPFMEDLFIDCVDHEYCLRLRQNGYKVIQSNVTLLAHDLGDIRIHSFMNVKFAATHHSALRRYFITRNRFYVMNKYKSQFPDYYLQQRTAFRRELLGIILFEKQKTKKMWSIIKGYLDYRKGFTQVS